MPIRRCVKSIETLQSIDTYDLVYNEVFRAPSRSMQFRNVMTGQPETSKKTQFLEAFEAFRADIGRSPHDPQVRPFVLWALDLPADGELSRRIRIPDEYKVGYVFRSRDEGDPAMNATITAAGSISEPHIDQAGCASFLIELLGRKIFVIWPPTPKNLKWFSGMYGLHNGAIFESALEQLEQPECVIYEQSQIDILPPGYIHGVLSPENSAIAGAPVVHSSVKSVALIAMEWESKVLEKRQNGSPLERSTVASIENGLKEDRRLWEVLEARV